MLDTPLIDLPTASQRLGVSPGILRAAILRGEIEAVAIGMGRTRRHYRVNPAELERWAAARATGGRP